MATGFPVTALTVPGLATAGPGRDGWPYQPRPAGSRAAEAAAKVALRAIPYFAWANRGPAQMRVWLPERPAPAGQ